MDQSEAVFASLRKYRDQLAEITPSLASLRLPPPPIIDENAPEDSPIQPLYIPGLKKLRASVKKEIDWLDRVFEAPRSSNLPSSNAPHLLALYRTLISAPYPVIGVNQSFLSSEPTVFSKPGSLKKKTKVDTKIHVLADGGKLWIKVLAMVNSRLLFELIEQDSYDNSDSSFSDDSNSSVLSKDANPDHLRTSLHKTARFMLRAANLLSPPPRIELQLPRLQPGGPGDDGRVLRTVHEIRSMGISVVHGNSPSTSSSSSLDCAPVSLTHYSISHPPPPCLLLPTLDLNLDLSLLLALVSAICHLPLPTDGDAEGVFKPLVRQYFKNGSIKKPEEMTKAMLGGSSNARALTIQLESELQAPMVSELVQLLSTSLETTGGNTDEPRRIKCWTTVEAKERLIGICSKLAGKDETERSEDMFYRPDWTDDANERRAQSFWKESRFSGQLGSVHLALSSVHLHPTQSSSETSVDAPSISHTSLPSPSIPNLDSLSLDAPSSLSVADPIPVSNSGAPFDNLALTLQALLDPSNRSMKPSASLTPHTLDSLLIGVQRGMTTVTTNRSSLRSLWSLLDDPSLGSGTRVDATSSDTKMKVKDGLTVGQEEDMGRKENRRTGRAVAWILEPRSLAESMKVESDLLVNENETLDKPPIDKTI